MHLLLVLWYVDYVCLSTIFVAFIVYQKWSDLVVWDLSRSVVRVRRSIRQESDILFHTMRPPPSSPTPDPYLFFGWEREGGGMVESEFLKRFWWPIRFYPPPTTTTNSPIISFKYHDSYRERGCVCVCVCECVWMCVCVYVPSIQIRCGGSGGCRECGGGKLFPYFEILAAV